jgi:hypothetical protein
VTAASRGWLRTAVPFLASLALATPATSPAAAQETSRTPFSAEDLEQECNANDTACRFEIGPVPPGHVWELRQVACENVLQSAGAAEIATLSMVGPGNNTLRRFSLLPVKLSENRFAISQRVTIPIQNRTIVRIVISTGSSNVVIGDRAYCTISGDDVEVAQP